MTSKRYYLFHLLFLFCSSVTFIFNMHALSYDILTHVKKFLIVDVYLLFRQYSPIDGSPGCLVGVDFGVQHAMFVILA